MSEEIYEAAMRRFNSLRSKRATFETHWEEVAQLVLPTYRNTFTYGSANTPGEKKTERQVDATAALALSRFAAICDSLLTPRNMFWHLLQADNDYLKKQREVRLWMEQTTNVMFKERYKPHANFASQNQNIYQSLGAFGSGMLWIDDYMGQDGVTGIRYSARPLGSVYFEENFQGQVNGFCRVFKLDKFQALHMAKERGWTLPEQVTAGSDNSVTDFLHRVYPRVDYEPGRLDAKGKMFSSVYLSITGQQFLSESGYYTFPAACTRYEQAPDEAYGRGPAMLVLPSVKTLNAEKTDFLTAGHRANNPPLLTTDDGLVGFTMRPGALNKGGMSPDGKPLVGVVPTGDIQVTKEMMDVEAGLINDAFLVSLFQILIESPQMTATEVVERINEKGILLAPTVGRQMSEYLGPMIARELDVLARQHKIPPMPPILRESGASYDVIYTSPLSRMMRAQEVAGFGRTVELALNVVNATGNPEPLDEFNFPRAIRASAEIQAVPESWMNSDEEKAAIRDGRSKEKEAMMQTQAAPAAAAVMKAQAVQKQAGIEPQKRRLPGG